MKNKFVLSKYIESAMVSATYDKLEDNSYCGRIENCQGVIAFEKTLRDCEIELQSVLEDWILLGLKQKHNLPVINGIDLNNELKDLDSAIKRLINKNDNLISSYELRKSLGLKNPLE